MKLFNESELLADLTEYTCHSDELFPLTKEEVDLEPEVESE